MTEETGKYEVSGNGVTRSELLNSRSLLLFEDPNYEPPTPEQIATAIKLTGLSSASIGKLLGIDSKIFGGTNQGK